MVYQPHWWRFGGDAKDKWSHGRDLINDLETKDTMAVPAYLHRKEGEAWNADYWYQRAGRGFHRPTLDGEWEALVEALLQPTS